MTERPVRVLHIDDDADMRRSLAEALTEHGFEVRGAADGQQGIDAFLRGGADVVLLDLGLPGMDGVSVCQALKTLAADAFLPVIFLTGQSDATTRVRVLEEGGDDYCAKPFGLEELCARIHVLLRIRDRELGLEHEARKLAQLALEDPLTELGNRRAFDAALDREWARTQRTGNAVGLLLVDIDRFKQLAERHGHETGDLVLRGIARRIARAIRHYDAAFRFGGEEFAVLLPEATPGGAVTVGERIRRSVAARTIGALSLTVSIGVAVAPDPAIADRAALVGCADRALFEAKSAGRDRVVSACLGVPS